MKRLLLSLFILLAPVLLLAQGVTTSSSRGKVQDNSAEPLAGTTPQFTFSGQETGKDRFDIVSYNSRWRMRVGIRYLFN